MDKFIPVSEPSITDKEINYVLDAVKSGWVSSIGRYISEFENLFAKYIGTKYALAASNGTTALHLALVSLEIKKGDEVIVPDLTFVATANAVKYTGAEPVFADIDPNTWCLDPESVKMNITKKTKAIIPVHLYGHPADMDKINRIAVKYGLHVIEDSAEAHGAEYKGDKVGGLGTCGVFSFYGNKIITTGEGGMITTNNETLYKKAEYFRDHAMSKEKRYWHSEIGFNYRMTNIQAALGLAQLERIDELINKKIQIFHHYKSLLDNIKGLNLNPETDETKNVFWMISIILEKEKERSRDEFMSELRKSGIDSRPFFYPLSRLPMYSSKKIINPIAQDISKRGLNLPSSTKLTKGDVEYICDAIKKLFK